MVLQRGFTVRILERVDMAGHRRLRLGGAVVVGMQEGMDLRDMLGHLAVMHLAPLVAT